METLVAVEVSTDLGIDGDFRGKSRRRQVTVISQEDWQAACAEIDAELPWHSRRANLLVEGISVAETAGRRLLIGEVELEITGETDPCQRMNEIRPGLQAALTPAWRGGICCRVTSPGTIQVGDAVSWQD